MIKRIFIVLTVLLIVTGIAYGHTQNELSFRGEAYHKNPERALEKAKSEALEKMLLSLAGIDIDEERIDRTTYLKDFSDSGTYQEKGGINFTKTLTITSGKLKGLRVRVESSCWKEGELFHAVALVFVDREEAEKARLRRELELALSEIKDSKRTYVQIPQNPGNCMREAITMLAEKFASAVEKDNSIKRIAVFDIAGDGNNTLRKEIISFLSKEKQYQLIERSDIKQILMEQKLSFSGIIDSDTVASPGKILGVDAIIFGEIQKVEEKNKKVSVEAYLKMVNVETGKIIWAGVVKGYSTVGPKTKAVGKHVIFGIISSGIILSTLHIGYSRGLIFPGENPTPIGLFMILFSTGFILLLYKIFYGHIPKFFLSILKSVGMVN